VTKGNGKYTGSDAKGYLTYQIVPGDPKSQALMSVLLTESRYTSSTVIVNGKATRPHVIRKAFAKKLEELGFPVVNKVVVYKLGRRSLLVNLDGKNRKIPVDIRTHKKGGRIDNIQVRVAAINHTALIKRLEALKSSLQMWGGVPAECVWQQEGWEEVSEKPREEIVDEKAKKQDEARLEETIRRILDSALDNKKEDISQIKNDLESIALRKAEKQDRDVKAGVIR